MSKERKHTFALTVTFDRPVNRKRAGQLLEDMINRNVAGLGRDHTRPGKPEMIMTRAAVKELVRVLAAENLKREAAKDDDALVRIAAKRVREMMK